MNYSPDCPICKNTEWEILGKRLYSLNDSNHLSDYRKIRIELLFDIWVTNKSEIEFTSLLCSQCGFVAFSPRPTSEDLNNKYQYLAKHKIAKTELTEKYESDNIRSTNLFHFLTPFLHENQKTLLDYGGGSGRLMSAFNTHNFDCSVVDFVEDTLPNITRLGSTIDDIPNQMFFDVIICSHVLEHLHDPYEVACSLKNHLDQQGILYIEVPLEIWNATPLPVEPVTHINFFTKKSMEILLILAGLKILHCDEGMYITEAGKLAFSIQAVAQNTAHSEQQRNLYDGAVTEAKSLVSPTLFKKMNRLMNFPEYRKQLYRQWVVNNLPKSIAWRLLS